MNHKPVFGITKEDIDKALKVLAGGNAATAAVGGEKKGRISLTELAIQLQFKGETMSESEMTKCLTDLIGEVSAVDRNVLHKPLTATQFAHHILGFNDYIPPQQQSSQDQAPK